MEDNLEKQVAAEEKHKKRKRLKEPETANIENTKINFRNGITVYEGKMTFLIAGAVITLLFSLAMYFFRLDISSNLKEVVMCFIMCIAGVTSIEQTINMMKGNGLFSNR